MGEIHEGKSDQHFYLRDLLSFRITIQQHRRDVCQRIIIDVKGLAVNIGCKWTRYSSVSLVAKTPHRLLHRLTPAFTQTRNCVHMEIIVSHAGLLVLNQAVCDGVEQVNPCGSDNSNVAPTISRRTE